MTADAERIDEAALVARVARGDAAAFARLVTAHATPLHRLAWRLLADVAEAEDVVQEAFARLWTSVPGWAPGEARPGAWLRRVARNLCLDRLRRRRFHDDGEVPDRADPAPPAAAALDEARIGEAVAAALAALPDRQRAALVLTYYEELPNAEAAKMLDMHLKAFESLLFRARAALRGRLEAAGVSIADLPEEAA